MSTPRVTSQIGYYFPSDPPDDEPTPRPFVELDFAEFEPVEADAQADGYFASRLKDPTL